MVEGTPGRGRASDPVFKLTKRAGRKTARFLWKNRGSALGADHVPAEIGAEYLRDVDESVGPLVVLEDHDQGAAEGDGGSIQGMYEPRPLGIGRSIPDIEPSGLVIGAIRGAGDLAVFAPVSPARHPRLE